MSLKRKLLGLAVLASLATAAVVVVNASANQEGRWFTPGNEKTEVYLVENATHTLEYSVEGVTPGYICNQTEWVSMSEHETEPSQDFFAKKTTECRTTGGIPGSVTFKSNGCALALYVAKETTETTEQTAQIICGAGNQMEIVHGACTITIPSQAAQAAVTYTKIVFNLKKAITAHFNLKLTIKGDGTCPKGTGTTGKLSGSVTIDAVNPLSVDLETK